MQRKLSEIAEIPKILSSTLATVSQTFDKLTNMSPPVMKELKQQRQFSYDEDACDYELSDNNLHIEIGDNGNDNSMDEEDGDGVDGDGDDGNSDVNILPLEFDAKEAYLELKKQVKEHQTQWKECTPESDYASEVDELDVDQFIQSASAANDEICETSKEYEVIADNYDDDDFLNATFTWSLRKFSKLSKRVEERDLESPDLNKFTNNYKSFNEKYKKNKNDSTIYSTDVNDIEKGVECSAMENKQSNLKLDKLEQCWPWADREKIIYKQSTCHLVPNKPLGLIEKRIQLLVRNKLLQHLDKTSNT